MKTDIVAPTESWFIILGSAFNTEMNRYYKNDTIEKFIVILTTYPIENATEKYFEPENMDKIRHQSFVLQSYSTSNELCTCWHCVFGTGSFYQNHQDYFRYFGASWRMRVDTSHPHIKSKYNCIYLVTVVDISCITAASGWTTFHVFKL